MRENYRIWTNLEQALIEEYAKKVSKGELTQYRATKILQLALKGRSFESIRQKIKNCCAKNKIPP
jgi:hypothetical protein